MNTAIIIIIFVVIAAIVAVFVLSEGEKESSGSSSTQNVGRFKLIFDSSFPENRKAGVITGAQSLSSVVMKEGDTYFLDNNLIPITIKKNNNIGADIIAQASRPSSADIYYGGTVEYNEIKMNGCDWEKITMHEFIHLMGFGSVNKWITYSTGVSLIGANFPKAHDYYELAAAPNSFYTNIPLQTDTPRSHWNETVFGVEIMTPKTSCTADNLVFSKITAGALEDLGFGICYTSTTIKPYTLT